MSNGTNSTDSGNDANWPLLDQDVAGPGVVMGFVLTGFLTLCTSELTFSIRKLDDPEYLKPIHAKSPRILSISGYWRRLMLPSYRPIAIWLAPKNSANPIKFWISTLERLTLNLADQQLITGLLIVLLGSFKYLPGFKDLGSFENAQAAAIFSAVTHLASVRTLRSYHREYRALRTVRLAIVGLTFLFFIGTHIWIMVWFERARGVSNAVSYGLAVMTWLTLGIGLSCFVSDSAIAARKAFDTSNSGTVAITRWRESIDAAEIHGSSRKRRNPVTAIALLLCRWYIATGPILRLCLTCLAELLFPWFTLSLTLWLLFGLCLYILMDSMAPIGQEDYGNPTYWGFGQLFSVLVILLPFFTLMEKYEGVEKESKLVETSYPSASESHLSATEESLPMYAQTGQSSGRTPQQDTYGLEDAAEPTKPSQAHIEYERVSTDSSLAEPSGTLIAHDHEGELGYASQDTGGGGFSSILD